VYTNVETPSLVAGVSNSTLFWLVLDRSM